MDMAFFLIRKKDTDDSLYIRGREGTIVFTLYHFDWLKNILDIFWMTTALYFKSQYV